MTRRSDSYFERFGFCERQIRAPAPAGLSLSVVIPCFNEPNLVATLESLRRCDPPRSIFEIIVVVNAPAGAPHSVLAQNRKTLEAARAWIGDAGFPVHLIEACDLPPRHAGVGLARKIGMDEALRRFDDVRTLDSGVMVCFDADGTCAPNYLCAVDEHFRTHAESPACSIYFEHPLEGELQPEVYEAITEYELHLRYYVQALRYAGFPHAYHTIGSSMAVRARSYMEQGGMNRRQAGEDFYFLHKLIPLGGFTELKSTTVFPSPRASNRVTFGTGRAVSEWRGEMKTYPLQAFEDLRGFLAAVPSLINSDLAGNMPEPVRAFLAEQDFEDALEEIRRHTSSAEAFVKRFYRWFDGFRAMKFVHHARDRFYGEEEVAVAAAELLGRIRTNAPPENARELLKLYRSLERGQPCPHN
jgi:cellulose synthase/poly-beta-1,6-N-acetylglucosamine synthase-like glycosyltransferase